MITVVETSIFEKQADKLFSEECRAELIATLAANPLVGEVIPGTGGVRKWRVPASGRGKRGGARVVYFYFDDSCPLTALLAYAKNTAEDLTPDQKKAISKLAAAIKANERNKK